jgi:cell division protease FtsH
MLLRATAAQTVVVSRCDTEITTKQQERALDKKTHINFWYVVIAIFAILFFQQWWHEREIVEAVPYNEFLTLLEDDQLLEIQVSDTEIRGKLRATEFDGAQFISTIRIDADIARLLADRDVEYTGVLESDTFSNIIALILPTALFIGVWIFIIRNMAARQSGVGGLMSIGKSKAKVYVETDIKVTFDDVAGVDEAKEELKEIIAFLKKPEEYGRLGAHLPKGVLLVGPPGTGKTLLARAIAGEAGVPFFSISGSEFVEMFVGVGAARVRDLFDQARAHAPCIIFIDELDALGRARGAGPLGGGHDEKEQTLNQLLSELDGFDTRQGVVLLSATNRPEILDPALLRAGRFDRQILVDRPDRVGRAAILRVHVRKVNLADAVVLDEVAALTPGFSGADLANLVNEAAIVATRRSATDITMDDFTAAIERIVAGLEKKSRILIPFERELVAYHETGHALVTLALQGAGTVQKISIIPRGIGALGYNIQRPTEDRYLMTRDELKDKMTSLLGGRAAEVLVLDKLSTGAADDLDKATDIARNMVTRYGMDETLGQATYAEQPSPYLGDVIAPQLQWRSYSERVAGEIDSAVQALVSEAFDQATKILSSNRQLLNETAEKLLQQETLSGNEIPTPVWRQPQEDRHVSGM